METKEVEKRLIFKNLVYSISANLLSLLVSIILVLILPNLLGETAYGYLQLYLFYTTYVGFFHLGWIDGIYLRIGGKEYGQLEGQLYATQFIVLMIFELIVGVMIVVFANVFVPDINRLHVIVLTCICMVIYIAKNYTTYILQATNRIKPYAIVTLIEKIIFAVIIIAAWVFRLGNYELIAIGDILGKLISTMVSLKYCKEILFCRMGNWKRTFQEIWINLSVGCKLLLANVAALLVNGIVRFAIERFWSIEVFGKVSLSMSLSNMLMVFISAISVVVFPMLKRMDEDKLGETYELIRNFLMIILLAALVFYYPAKHILTLFLPTYAESLKYMALMFPVCIFDSKISLLVNTYLKALRKEKTILIINISVVIVSMISTYFTVYIMHSLEMAVVSIVILMALQCAIAELYLSKYLGIDVIVDMVMEWILVTIFILASWFIDSWISMAIYFAAFIIYCIIKRDKIKSLIKVLR